MNLTSRSSRSILRVSSCSGLARRPGIAHGSDALVISKSDMITMKNLQLIFTIVKRVSWFKSSLLLGIINKHTYKY